MIMFEFVGVIISTDHKRLSADDFLPGFLGGNSNRFGHWFTRLVMKKIKWAD